MNILILGGGGREHAFAWKLKQSPLCEQLLIAPGNAGTAQLGQNIDIGVNDFDEIKKVVLDQKVEMLIVGPEAPLVNGIWDYFKADPELKEVMVIGPSKEGATLEGSKAFSKVFMEEFDIPTAAYREFGKEDLKAGLEYIDQLNPPVVLKADGLAAGKGVIISTDKEEAKKEFSEMLGGKFGVASEKIVIEDFLDGIEFSVFVLTDGKDYKILPIAKDYKRIGEGDTGLNTGGMGAVSPVAFVDAELLEKVETRIVQPTIKGLQTRGITYHGFVFIGLIKIGDDPYVIEYNCRMGDPETEVVFPRLKNDLVKLLEQLAKGQLSEAQIEIDERAATTVMLVSGGYPGSYEKGKAIQHLEQVDDCIVFHAGTRLQDGQVLTNGGRVMALTAYGENFRSALEKSKSNAAKIDFEGKYFRGDIGFDL